MSKADSHVKHKRLKWLIIFETSTQNGMSGSYLHDSLTPEVSRHLRINEHFNIRGIAYNEADSENSRLHRKCILLFNFGDSTFQVTLSLLSPA